MDVQVDFIEIDVALKLIFIVFVLSCWFSIRVQIVHFKGKPYLYIYFLIHIHSLGKHCMHAIIVLALLRD